MNYGELLYEVPNELRRLYHALERQKRKTISIKWSCPFNEVCLKENLMPNYTKNNYFSFA